jgi:hypothetical protein
LKGSDGASICHGNLHSRIKILKLDSLFGAPGAQEVFFVVVGRKSPSLAAPQQFIVVALFAQ